MAEISDIQSFPILTEEVGSVNHHYPGTGQTDRHSAPIGGIVQHQLSQILGWRPRSSDPKGFVAALQQSFKMVETDGKKNWTWLPHSYTAQIDIGAVTGAQASLYQRAQVILRETLPILERLMPLIPDSDEEDVDASRAIIESDLTELANELGHIGGPRTQRVDAYFVSLLGDMNSSSDFVQAVNTGIEDGQNLGQLGILGRRMGLTRFEINTVEEEQNLTDFLVLVDYIVSLQQSWNSQKGALRPDAENTEVYLGTQLVWIGRELASLAEAVQQAYFVLDSVFIGPADRESVQLLQVDENGMAAPSVTIAELLSWAEHVATEEGPRLIRDGGKSGVLALLPTLRQLSNLLEEGVNISRGPSDNSLSGFHTPRVQHTFQELYKYADRARALSEQLTFVAQAPAPVTPKCDIQLADCTISPAPTDDKLILVTFTVHNRGDAPCILRGPEPGHIYTEGQTYKDVPQEQSNNGGYSVGVDYTNNGHNQEYPYRWGLDKPLEPGEFRTIMGYIIPDPKKPKRKFWAGLLNSEGQAIVDRKNEVVISPYSKVQSERGDS